MPDTTSTLLFIPFLFLPTALNALSGTCKVVFWSDWFIPLPMLLLIYHSYLIYTLILSLIKNILSTAVLF